MEIKIAIEPLDPHVHLLTLEGDLDICTVEAVKDAVDQLLQKGHRSIIIDMNNLDFLDTTGMQALVHAVVQVEHYNGILSFVSANSRVMRIFQFMGLSKSKYFKIFKTLEEAQYGLATLAPECKTCAVRNIPFCATVKSFAYTACPCNPAARLPWIKPSNSPGTWAPCAKSTLVTDESKTDVSF